MHRAAVSDVQSVSVHPVAPTRTLLGWAPTPSMLDENPLLPITVTKVEPRPPSEFVRTRSDTKGKLNERGMPPVARRDAPPSERTSPLEEEEVLPSSPGGHFARKDEVDCHAVV